MRFKLFTTAVTATVAAVIVGAPATAAPAAPAPAAGARAASNPGTATLSSATAVSGPQLNYVPNPTWWGTNGRVVDILPAGNRVYIAGGFDYVGPPAGYGVAVGQGAGTKLAGAPLIDGPVYAAVPDGQGGWYVGGDFDRVGSVYRKGAAQITAAGQVTDWNPKPDGPVRALAVVGNSVVLGGSFANVGVVPAPANNLAAVDTATGVPRSGWSAAADGTVSGLVPAAGGAIYAVGSFSHVDGATHSGVVRLDAATGAVDQTFTGQTKGAVSAAVLSAGGGVLYLGGGFTAAGNGATLQPRTGLAGFRVDTGSLMSWAPKADGAVRALATDPAHGTVFVGGLFGQIGRQARTRLAALTPNGTVLPFRAGLGCNTPHTTKDAHANPACTPEVDSLAVTGGTLYVGGRFAQSYATQRHDAAVFSLSWGRLTAWNPVASNRVLTLAPAAGAMFLGGHFTSVNGVVRRGVAALNAATGAVDPSFDADANNMVLGLALAPNGSRLYLAGHFTKVRGVPRSHLASVLTVSGAPDPVFKPVLDNDALAVGVANNSLYVAGQFRHVGAVSRSHVAKLSLTTGAVDPAFRTDTVGPTGALQAGGMVQAMQISHDGSKVYLGGPFQTVNGKPRVGLAVVDGHTGALFAHQLGGVQSCRAGRAWVTHLYLSSDGRRLYGGDLCPDYLYQWNTVTMSTSSNPTGLNWKTLCNAGMQGALERNGHFFYGTHGGDAGQGGHCWATPSGGTNVVQQRYFVFSAASGAVQPDRTQFDSAMGVWSLAAVPQGLLVGGDFTYAGSIDHTHQGLVLFPGTL